MFEQCGDFLNPIQIKVLNNDYKFGYVYYKAQSNAEEAIQNLNGLVFDSS
jgi:hypothetical protein